MRPPEGSDGFQADLVIQHLPVTPNNMHTPQTASEPLPQSLTTWRWISRWPSLAQVALVVSMFLSGSQAMGSYRWIQGAVCAVWIGWLLLEVFFDRENPRTQKWGWWRRAFAVVIGVLGLTYVIYELVHELAG